MSGSPEANREELTAQLVDHQAAPLKFFIWDIEIEDYIEAELSDVSFTDGEIVVKLDAK